MVIVPAAPSSPPHSYSPVNCRDLRRGSEGRKKDSWIVIGSTCPCACNTDPTDS